MKYTEDIFKFKLKASSPEDKTRESIVAFLGSVITVILLLMWFADEIIEWGYYESYWFPFYIEYSLIALFFTTVYWWVVILLSVLVSFLVIKFAKSPKILLRLSILVWLIGVSICVFLAIPQLQFWSFTEPEFTPAQYEDTEPPEYDEQSVKFVVIHTTDGRELEGQVISETDDSIHLKLENGEVTIYRREIEAITTLTRNATPLNTDK